MPRNRNKLSLSRLIRNIVRLPRRIFDTIRWRVDPVYRLQLAANRTINRTFDRELIKQLEQIPGNSSPRECRLLAYLSMQSPENGQYVEIGALFGKSTAWLVEAAQSAPGDRSVISIDPHLGGTWDGFSETVKAFSLAERGLDIRRDFSHDVGGDWNEPIAFLWIDGSHDYRDVLNDIEDFVPHVVAGGWIVFDDAASQSYPDVTRAISERMHGRTGIEKVGIIKNFAVFRSAA